MAVHPDDSEMMLLAIGLLQKEGSEASLTRAAGYATRVIDRIEKTPPEEKSARISQKDWQAQQDRFRTALYSLRGQIEKSQMNYEAAAKDFQQSYSLHPNAMAAEQLGEIAEMKNDYAKAIEEYSLAFVLPEDGPSGKVDRREVRMKLGNVWRRVHGTDQGLGEQILAAYDRLGAAPQLLLRLGRETRTPKDSFAFVLRNLDGSLSSSFAIERQSDRLEFLGYLVRAMPRTGAGVRANRQKLCRQHKPRVLRCQHGRG